MRIEVRCASCRAGWLVEEAVLAEGFRCPACSAAISPDGKGARGSGRVSVKDRAGAAKPKPAARATADAAAAPRSAAKSVVRRATRRPVPIVCPRCNLHFLPRTVPVTPSDAPRPTILVVGDEVYFRRIAEEALAPRFEVRVANSITDARRLVDSGAIDVLVVDRTVLTTDRGGSLLRGGSRKMRPILIFAAQDESEMYGESWEKLRRLGADDVVLKGMKAGEALCRKVSALLGMDAPGDDPFA